MGIGTLGLTNSRIPSRSATTALQERVFDPSTIPLLPDVPVPEIGKHMKCSSCGSWKIDSRPERLVDCSEVVKPN
jgi:hypothetical protein